MATVALVLTCEHGGARVPARWRALVRGEEALLASHRGYDAGALHAARRLARELGAPLCAATTTRLLVDLNRSAHNPRRFSRLTRGLPVDERARLHAEIYAPHRARVEAMVERARAEAGAVLHVAVHSFTPVLGDDVRDYDVGLLYDPGRTWEQRLATAWALALAEAEAVHGVRRNAPYRGVSDGLTRGLRRLHPDRAYAGIELELSQRCLVPGAGAGGRFDPALLRAIVGTLRGLLAGERQRGARPGDARRRGVSRSPLERGEPAK